MTEVQASKSTRASAGKTAGGRLFVLDLSGGRVLAVNPDGSDKKVLVTGCRLPDGLVVDREAGQIYWTNMGVPESERWFHRARGPGRWQSHGSSFPRAARTRRSSCISTNETASCTGRTGEGMRVMRANLDGTQLETLVDTSKGEAASWARRDQVVRRNHRRPRARPNLLDAKGPDDAGLGRIFRASIDMPKGESAARRTDIEVLFDRLPEPIDLELDLEHRVLYWTDRGDPRGAIP